MLGVAEFPALGTGVRILVTRPELLAAARQAVTAELAAIDAACSRFRDDSELARVNRAAGRTVAVGPLLAEVLAESLRVARMTEGAVDPTVGRALRLIGYDVDFAAVPRRGGPLRLLAEPVPGWEAVELDAQRGLLRVPPGVELDLGSTAKAFAADRCARAGLEAMGEGGLLVSLGGDIAMAGACPPGGWRVLVTDCHSAPLDGRGQVVSLTGGALATSSTRVRRWARGGAWLHHIVDPATGLPAREHWRTVSVGAGCCVDANAAATASIVWGPRAPEWLTAKGLPARLVRTDGGVVTVAGWPREEVCA
ncbi:MAG TPA: FAD:protein FMN transferase [Candidatus Dormibacteraeota bacterium]|nr:FAD:protein FMN transferase [Candidatus Dormibacteraeota bacterium]